MGNKLTIFLCVFLHAILVLIYAAILVTYQIGVYDRPLSLSQGTVRTVITVVSQSFTIAYCAVMVLLTQRITLNGFMKRPQTLTAIHDKSSAWLGLGASLQTLGRQRKLITDLLGISMITLYLLLIFVVHTTLPGIFGVTTQNVTTFATYPTTLARQLITINNYTLLYVLFETWSSLFVDALTANSDDEDDWSILSVYNTLNLTTAGVWNNILYDIIPPVENATGAAVEVNATIFSVDCAPLPDVVQTGFDSDNNFGRPGPAYNYEFGSGKYSGVFSPAALVLQVGSVQSADSESADESSPSMIVVISPLYPVVDSIGTQAPTMNMQNPSLVLPEDDPPMNVTFIGCNFSVQNSSISVDSRSRTPIELSAPPTSVNWPDWTDPGVSSDPLLGDDTLQSFPFAPVEPMVGGLDIRLIFNATFNQTLEGTSSILESFLDNDIGATSTNLTVGDINWSLGRAYAATIWYQNTILVPTDSGFNETSLLRGEASIPSSVLQERLTVNTISVSIQP
ncbi:hypothetical protein NM688_g9210 [Phlebia brevispora]|uniref:Uncharacterized protein n=1 Tax=Phlebia brevispora TaxID=194682 RepID=A0ACC1RIA6_9APHY|nr:hypothetical protein NM688_g9210 [Phlebia brevispora]